jgi:mannose-1-phosphate guanylyltransferase
MAGGKGERFWPLSTRKRPKPFMKLIGNTTMIQMTVNRVLGFVPKENISIVLGRDHLEIARSQLADFSESQFIVEPAGRDTAPCIGLAASMLFRKDPDGVLIVLPADHYIPDTAAFIQTMSRGVRWARSGRFLITTGIRPTRPEVGYGYIKAGAAVGTSGDECYRVDRFVEKPEEATARQYLSEGTYFWNSGIFMGQAKVVLSAIERHMPWLFEGLRDIEQASDAGDAEKVGTIFSSFAKISIDYGVMEKAENVVMVKADFEWDDVGTWSSLTRVMDTDENGNFLKGNPVCVDTKDCVIYSDGITIGTVGVSRLIIVASRDGVLVCDLDKDQATRQVARMIEEQEEG